MYLLFDVGGTNSRAAVSNDGVSISGFKVINTVQDFEQGINNLIALGKELTANHHIDAVAGGFPAQVTSDHHSLIHPAHLPNWGEQDIVARLNQAFSSPVFIANDAELIGLAEANNEAGAGHKVIGFVAIGTGIGGAKFVEGKVVANKFGFEPGHQIIDIEGDKFISWEELVSGSGIMQRLGKPVEEIDNPNVIAELNKFTALGLNNLRLTWSPELFILGGGLVNKGMIRVEVVQHYMREIDPVDARLNLLPELKQATLGDQGGLYGALQLIKQRL